MEYFRQFPVILHAVSSLWILPNAQTSTDDTLQNHQQQFTLYRVTLAPHIRSSVTWPYNPATVTCLYKNVSIPILYIL